MGLKLLNRYKINASFYTRGNLPSSAGGTDDAVSWRPIVCHLFSRLDRIIGAFVDTHVKRLEEENRLSIVIQPASLAQEHA